MASSPVMPSKPCEKLPGSNSTVVPGIALKRQLSSADGLMVPWSTM